MRLVEFVDAAKAEVGESECTEINGNFCSKCCNVDCSYIRGRFSERAQHTQRLFPRLLRELLDRGRATQSNRTRSWRGRTRTHSGERPKRSIATSGSCRRPGLRQTARECRLAFQTLSQSLEP